MTYCLGMLVKEGLAMIGDTRTNAGVDNIAVYRKLHIFDVPGERAIVVATAGNLATSQTVISLLNEGFENPDTRETESIFTINSMFKCAHFVGRAVQEAHRMITPAQSQAQGVGFDVPGSLTSTWSWKICADFDCISSAAACAAGDAGMSVGHFAPHVADQTRPDRAEMSAAGAADPQGPDASCARRSARGALLRSAGGDRYSAPDRADRRPRRENAASRHDNGFPD